MGDGWISNDLLAWAEELGVEIDLTLEPGRPAQDAPSPDKGRWPDYARIHAGRIGPSSTT